MEAQARILEAMRLVEEAQGLLYRACEQLSPVIGAMPQWSRAGALAERCKRLWHALEAKANSTRIRMDGLE